MTHLFEPLTQRGVTFRNRVGMSPMCTYSARDGEAGPWHLVHLGSRGAGGCGMIMVEATAVSPEGRISPADLGLWRDGQAEAVSPIARFIRERGAVAGVQLAHAGRKASTRPPTQGRGPLTDAHGGWPTVAPFSLPFNEGYPAPRELTHEDLGVLITAWCDAALRARKAGFELVELHMAHGYLLHQFLSPLTNLRQDEYGGSLSHRMRFPLAVASAVRAVWPVELPLWVRISATDWVAGGWDLEQAVAFGRELKRIGVDLIDCSSGGAVPGQNVPMGPGYQVPFAERIRREVGMPTAAVGLITEPVQAEEILREGRADFVLLGRELLRDPYWPLRAAAELGHTLPWPEQYGWAVG